jgi:V/A-type H+/Na+-transporting ATPase subunit I
VLSPEPMRHLSLVVLAEDLELTTRAIARVGVLHLLDVSRALGDLPAIRPHDVHERREALDGLGRRIEDLFRQLAVRVPDPGPVDVASDRLDLPAARARVDSIAAEIDGLGARILGAADETARLERLARNLRLVEPIQTRLDDLRLLRYARLAIGLVPERHLPRLRESLARIAHVLEPVGPPGADRRIPIVALCLLPDAEVLERALRAAQLEPLELPPDARGTPAELVVAIQEQIAAARARQPALAEERAAMAQRIGPELQALRSLVERERLLVEAQALMGCSERTALVSGWVPVVLAGRLERAVRDATAGRCVLQWREPAAVEGVRRGLVGVPILLRNPILMRPFERLLRAYGLPRYGDIEPTPIVAVAFLAMFGFMFGDVGQGAVLFAIGYFIYRRMFRHRDYAVILMECGVFAIGFGFLYGSVFGVERWLPALWLRPLEEIPRLVRAAVGFGIVLLSLGLGMNLANALRRRDSAVLWERNGLLAALAYWVAVGLLVRRMTGGPGTVTLGTALLWLALPVVLIVLKEPLRALWSSRRAHRWPGASELSALVIQSLVELLDTAIAALAHTATFVRLAAFALSHAGLFLATFAVADAVRHSGGGTIGAALVLVAGNAVIIALEGLIVSIQTLRLEYYEFFSKFYAGGGEAYRPLRLTPQKEAA